MLTDTCWHMPWCSRSPHTIWDYKLRCLFHRILHGICQLRDLGLVRWWPHMCGVRLTGFQIGRVQVLWQAIPADISGLAHWNSLFIGFLTETVPNENIHWNFQSVGYPNELETMNFHWNFQWASGWNARPISMYYEFQVETQCQFPHEYSLNFQCIRLSNSMEIPCHFQHVHQWNSVHRALKYKWFDNNVQSFRAEIPA